MNRYIMAMLSFIACLLCFFTLVPEIQAPEITERDILGYDAYHVAEGGAILDRDGIIKGWVQGNIIYDAQWNIEYRIDGSRLYKVGDDIGM